jgi:hypothetical protein
MAASGSGLHLGAILDPVSREPTGQALHVESDRFTTHGVIVGMTGSGKTGLGVVLLEEVLSRGVPALIIDPKGDLGNLALVFPELGGEDFEPWVDEGEADREGLSKVQLARRTAERWKEGLARSGIDPDRMRAFRDGADVRILTPGSTAGIPVDVLGNLSAPEGSWDEHAETLRDEIEGLVSGLLLLAGIESDPLTSREHILLSNLVERGWRDGRDLDLATLLGWIQDPPLRRLGVFDLETFFPARDRLQLAMKLNGLVASPSFAEWMQGAPLDVADLLWAPDGRPRASIVHLAHLSDVERQFVVTLVLSKVVTWMRRQPGTSELRALVYIDEVFGFAPPTAEPPSKRPMLTIFKQARAHGVGMVVSTQNPVDLDYKLMSNAGTWMVGRLQTERDKARIVEALRSASGDVDVGVWDERIGALGKRQFLLETTAATQPTLFATRWAMSFLRGPMTRAELVRLRKAADLAESRGAVASGARASAGGTPGTATQTLADDESPVAPTVADGVAVGYLDPGTPWARAVGVSAAGRRLGAGVAVRVRLLFDEARADIRHEEEWEAVLLPLSAAPRPEDAVSVDYDARDFRDAPVSERPYVLPEAPIAKTSFFRNLAGAFEDHLFRSRTVEVLRNPKLKLYGRVGESRDDFVARCLEVSEQRADEAASKLRDRYERRLDAARDRTAQAERRIRELEVDVGQRRQQEVIAGAGEILGMFLGGRRRVRSLSGAASRRSQTVRTQERLRSAEQRLDEYENAVRDLEDELSQELQDIWQEWRSAAEDVETLEVGLEKTDVRVEEIRLFWAPIER